MTQLRGVVVPIVDLRHRFELDAACGSDNVTVVLGIEETVTDAEMALVAEPTPH